MKSYKVISSLFLAVFFTIIAASSRSVKLASLPLQTKNQRINVGRILPGDGINKTFCVCHAKSIAEEIVQETESVLANNQVKVIDWSNLKKIQAEKELNMDDSRAVVDYYILINGTTPLFPGKKIYYYELLEAATSKILFAGQSEKITYEFLMQPFFEGSREIELNFTKYFKTATYQNYNSSLNAGNNNEIIKESNSIASQVDDNTLLNSKSKFKADIYGVYLNLATSYLLLRDFQHCFQSITKANEIRDKYNYAFNDENSYSDKLYNTCLNWEEAINDSINIERSKMKIAKKSITFKSERFKESYNIRMSSKIGHSANTISALESAYFKVAQAFFKKFEFDINEKNRIETMLDQVAVTTTYNGKSTRDLGIISNSNSKSTGADYLIDIEAPLWTNEPSSTREDLIGASSQLSNPLPYNNNINGSIKIKVTSIGSGLLIGSQTFSYSNVGNKNKPEDLSDDELLNKIFNENQVLSNFIKKVTK